MLKEQFLRKCHNELRLVLKERTPKTLKDVIGLTEQYLAARGGPMWRPSKVIHVKQRYKTTQGKLDLTTPHPAQGASPKQDSATSSSNQKSSARQERRCFVCGREGHFAKVCRTVAKVPISTREKVTGEETGACV